MINGISASLGDENRSKAISIKRPDDEAPLILVDPKWFELILQNLLSNAVSHSPCGTTIGIILEVKENLCRMEMHNQMSVPLTEEDLNHIFRRFWQKDLARESGIHAGIGLSLVKSYADLMSIDVDAWVVKDRFHIVLSGIPVTKTSWGR
jgi:signal transduction histidine kinase